MTRPADPLRRWDTDDRYRGVADASAFAAGIDELAGLARRPDWVAEDPQAHLAAHLRDASGPGLLLVRATAGPDGVLKVEAEHTPAASRREIRTRAWALIGAVAETMASVREYRDGDRIVFDVVTGEPGGPGAFASHGHTLRLILTPGQAPMSS